MKALIFSLIIFFLSGSGYIYAKTELNDLNEKLESLYFQGDYVGAIKVAKKALQTAERDFDCTNIVALKI
jgi:hypothetical protein